MFFCTFVILDYILQAFLGIMSWAKKRGPFVLCTACCGKAMEFGNVCTLAATKEELVAANTACTPGTYFITRRMTGSLIDLTHVVLFVRLSSSA